MNQPVQHLDDPTLACLNGAFQRDPAAFQALLCNRVPCNRSLADDPLVVVEQTRLVEGHGFTVGALGLVNAILEANGLPLVAAMFSDEPDELGRCALVGFCRYELPKQAG